MNERAKAIQECIELLAANVCEQSGGQCCDNCNCQGARYTRDAMVKLLRAAETRLPEAAQKMWLVEFDGQPQAAYPRMVQAEVYASGFSRAAKIIEGTFAVSPPLHKEKP